MSSERGSNQHGRDIALLRKFVYRAAGFSNHHEIPEGYELQDALADAERRLDKLDELDERMDQIEHGFAQLVTDLPTSKRSKREKMYAIVEHALENGRGGKDGVTISKDAASGAAGCSPRHVLNLFDALDSGFEWAEKDLTREQARLKIGTGDKSNAAFLDALTSDFPEVDET